MEYLKKAIVSGHDTWLHEQQATVRNMRRFLAAAHGFLRGEQALIDVQALSLESALRARLGEIKGTPRNPSKKNRLDRITFLLTNMQKTIETASALEPDVLTADTVESFEVAEGVSSWLKNAAQAAGLELPDPPPVADATDALGGATGFLEKPKA